MPWSGNNNALMRAGVERLAWRGNRIRRNVAAAAARRTATRAARRRAHQSMNVSYVPRARRGAARASTRPARADGCCVGARARRRRDAAVPRSAGPARGPRLRVHARHAVILAASAIQTPLFLLQASGLGKRRGWSAQRLQAHPGTAVMGVFDEPVELWFGATQGYETTHFWNERMKFETVGMPLELAAARLPGLGAAAIAGSWPTSDTSRSGACRCARAAHGRVRPQRRSAAQRSSST